MTATEVGAANVRLAAGQPAYLEVQLDPAAHGPGGVGQWMRVTTLRTASGQELEFVVRAEVTP